MDSRSALPPPTLPPPGRPPLMVPPSPAPTAPTVPSLGPSTSSAAPPGLGAAVPRTGYTPHAPIDIAALRRPKRRVRSTIVTTTVVGIFLAALTTGVVLAWRKIDEPSARAVPAASPSADEASVHWKDVTYGDFAFRVPQSATLETDADGTVNYTTMVENLFVSVGPYHVSLVGHEEEWAHQTIGQYAAQLPGTLSPIETVTSAMGPAYRATIDAGNSQIVHVRLLFVANTMILIVGQGDDAGTEPWPVTAAWNAITYKGATATSV